MRIMYISHILVLTVTLLVGCAQRAPVYSYSDSQTQHPQRIIIQDRSIHNALLYKESMQKRMPDGQILVQANFQNRYKSGDIWADVKVEFLDENNMLVDATEWVPTFFPAMQVTLVQGSSISGSAVTYTMSIRDLRTRDGNVRSIQGTVYEMPGD